MALTIVIADTWNGRSLPPDQHVTLRMHGSATALVVDVDAPYWRDPPPPGPPGPTWELWNHEVVELFIAGPDQRYLEVELSPHGHHLVLRLHGTRQVVQRELPLAYTCRIEGRRWIGRARIRHRDLPPGPHRINATAIHGQGDDRQYLSYRPLPGDQPDFHQLDAFAAVALPLA